MFVPRCCFREFSLCILVEKFQAACFEQASSGFLGFALRSFAANKASRRFARNDRRRRCGVPQAATLQMQKSQALRMTERESIVIGSSKLLDAKSSQPVTMTGKVF